METKQMCSKLGNFSEWLREELDTRSMSVARLSQLSGVHPNTIRNYLSKRCEPTLYNVLCLVNALGYDLGVISK
jgi:lambda repressor-like predicted transcriptional regulator